LAVIGAAFAAEEAGHGHGGSAGSMPDPMHQFEIKRIIPLELFGFDASFTNSALPLRAVRGREGPARPGLSGAQTLRSLRPP
jgi:hypothetical protein